MAGRTLKSLVSRRRHAGDEGEDEEGPVVVDDSQSEGSIMTEPDSEDGDAGASALGDQDDIAPLSTSTAQALGEETANGTKTGKTRKPRKKGGKKPVKEPTPNGSAQSSFLTVADTDAMMNGLKIDGQAQDQPAVEFEGMEQDDRPVAPNGYPDASQQRHDHQEYRRQRDQNPAFTPNRGGFYMHDSRAHPDGRGPGLGRGAWQGRGRGRGGPLQAGGPSLPTAQATEAIRATEGPWRHDLHDTINEELPPQNQMRSAATAQDDGGESARLFGRATAAQDRQAPPPVISFSSATLVGKVNLQVLLPGMKASITYSEVPVKRYTRLPNHRPPLRRDKPVRISLPDHPPKYIFPSPDRSFIFIPRQMRPHQQGFGRYSNSNRSVGGHGYSSRRTSMYGGSIYSVSVAPSRRPSIASQIGREPVFSPAASIASGMQPPPYRPVVRMPPNAQLYSGATTPAQQFSGYQTPTMPPMQNFPPPQQPTFQGTPTTNVQHPRPQKAISVSGIDSPAMLAQASQPLDQQPFQGQLPSHMTEQPSVFLPQQPPYYSPTPHYPLPQPQAQTPLGGIPENAVHAQPFQAPSMPYGQAFYPSYAAQQQGFHSYPPMPSGYQPMYPPSANFGVPAQALPPQQLPDHHQQQPSGVPQHQRHSHQTSQSQSGFVAYEENGMVYYRPASEAQQKGSGAEQGYQPAESFTPSYAVPPGHGGGSQGMAPHEQGFYGYPPQTNGLQEMGGAMFYSPPGVGMQGQQPG